MPRVTQYIRDEDFDKWTALPNKSEFIHNSLKKLTSSKDSNSRFEGPLCKVHGLPLDGRGRCLQKGCKFA